MRNILSTFLTILMLLPVSAMGEIITIKNPVKQISGSAQSLNDARISSMAQAKMETLEAEKQSTEELKKDTQQAFQGLTATDWLKKASSLWDGEKYTDPKKAIEYLSNAIKLQPDDADVYNSRGNVYYKLGQFQSAIEDYNEVIRLKPDYVNAYYNLANAYYKLGQYERAVEDLKIAAGLGHEVAQIILKSYSVGNVLITRKPGKEEANPQYKAVKGIVLKNGEVIEGQIISIESDKVKIRTKEGSILSYSFNEEVQGFIDDVTVIKTPEKQSQPLMENAKASEEANPQYKAVKGIVLKNGEVIEGQIISINSDKVRIRTKDGKISSYDFNEEVQGFIQDEVAVIKIPEMKSQPLIENDQTSEEAALQYKGIRGIVLKNGDVIEEQVISIKPDRVRIRTKQGKILSYDLQEEVQGFIKDEVAVIKTPEKQSQSSTENAKDSEEANPQYKKIKGIELTNGEVIEGQIISVNTDILKIRTKEGKVVSYSFKKEVLRFIEK
jgi:tetratricopeptide (TPR) repeat protein